MNNITHRNPNLSSFLTTRNVEADDITIQNYRLNNVTSRNNIAEDFTNFAEGTLLFDKYVVKSRMKVTSGEANIYVCEYNDEEYVAKVYNHKNAVKPEIIETLQSLDSPYVAKIYETGEYEDMPVTILPYYRLGSLQGKKFSLKQLKRMIIPFVNDALKSLHNIGILHKDLKPANIMIRPDGVGVALIDFGISSVIDNNSSMIITKSGWTLAYASPEALRGVYLEESDYYSFGITLYELFCGHNPYENLNAEEVARYLAVQKLPYPENMPQKLKDLITALTYNDLTNRNDLDNPNRRWTYEEVEKWLDGEDQPIPGETKISIEIPIVTKNFDNNTYKFDGKKHSNLNELVPALAKNWLEGKKHLTRKLLSEFFRRFDPELASYCMDAEEEIQRGEDSDFAFWKVLYKLAPDLEEFFWKGKKYSSLKKFGQDMLIKLRLADMSNKNFWDEVINWRLLSQYLEIHSQPQKIIDGVKALENTNRDRRNERIKYYLLAYLLMGKKELRVEENNFSTTEELAEHMNNLLGDSFATFEKFCYKLIYSKNALNEEFEAWLISLGKRNELNSWKQNLKTA